MINQCLIGKTSGYNRPRYPVLQMLRGIITSSNFDYAELMWEEFVQAIQTFLTDKDNLGSPTKKGRKDKAHVIPYCRFTKLIICHLGRTNNIHQRSTSSLHLAEEDLRLVNLKFVPKAKKMSCNRKGRKEEDCKCQAIQVKVCYREPKPAKEKSTKATPLQKADKGKVAKVCNMKSSFQLVDEPNEEPAQPEPETEPEHQVEGKGKAIVTEEQAAQSLLALHTPKRRSTTDQFIFQRRIPATEKASTRPSAQPQDDTSANIVRDSLSLADAKTGVESDKTNNGGNTEILQITEELGEDVDKQVNLKEKTIELNQDQAGSDPGETHESRPPPEQVLMDEDQAGPDPGISHKDPLSLTGTLSSMKNLDDAYAIGDPFINVKSTDDEPRKLNVEAEVVSMVTVLIYQASSSVPPLSTPVIDLSPPKPASFNTQAPIFTAITTTIKQQPSTSSKHKATMISELAICRVYTLGLRICLTRLMKLFVKQSKRLYKVVSIKSLLEHVALYEALEASMAWEQKDKFLAEKDKSCKQRRDDQDPLPLPPDSDLSKKKQHDSGASSSS
ncbi:hypothetical protein Tco_0401193 [Tanacetum coccineum]